MVVYITQDYLVGWEYPQLPERLRPAVVEFQRLIAIANSALAKRHRPQLAFHLGSALYGAFLSKDDNAVLVFFEGPRAFIERKCAEQGRMRYILLSMAVACGVLFVLGLLYLGRNDLYILRDAEPSVLVSLFLGLTGGTIGAVISIVQRSKTLVVDPMDTPGYLALQGMIRVLLGTIFGGFLIIGSLAGISFGVFKDDLFALAALSVIAGFSERLVPDIMERTSVHY
jgi:hypothetical protein